MDVDANTIEVKLDFSFRNKSLLEQALRHPSYVNEHPESGDSNQRMEFLGDAFLDAFVALTLYQEHPSVDEGLLTEMRSQIVSGRTLARVARHLDIGKHLLLGQGEIASGGNGRESNLAAALEALLGAALLDRGYHAAQKLALSMLKTELSEIGSEKAGNPKSRLQQVVHRMGKASPTYRLIGSEGPAHRQMFVVEVLVDGEVLGKGQGRRKLDAEQEAAREALNKLEHMP